MARVRANTSSGGGGGNTITFSHAPYRYNASLGSVLNIPTDNISHFKSVIDPDSQYAHYNGYVVGYSNTKITSAAVPTLTDSVALNVADFDVNKSYAYLVVCVTVAASDRLYDITLTLD